LLLIATQGEAVRNKQLSERRAERVKQILVDHFEIAADQLSTKGLGDAHPIASNATPQGRRANRRAEVLILNSAGAAQPAAPWFAVNSDGYSLAGVIVTKGRDAPAASLSAR